MKRILSVAIALSTGLLASPAFAGIIDASATISSVADGANTDYTITLTNTSGVGNDSIATFWFSWVPGENFMNTSPISVTDPTGWKDVLTQTSGPPSGTAIQFDSLSPATSLAPGASETFSFVSATTPAELMGNSPAFPTQPELTAFIYSQGPLEGDGQQILAVFSAVSSVPEPSSLVLGLFGIVTSFGLMRSINRKKVV
jgi:PEP-CTERM motif